MIDPRLLELMRAASAMPGIGAALPAPQGPPHVGLLDRIGDALFTPPKPIEGLIGQEDVKNAQKQGLLQLGTGLLAQSGPTTRRVGLGQAIGNAIQGAQQGYQGAIDTAMQRGAQATQYHQIALKNDAAARSDQLTRQILEKYPQPDGSDPAALRRWIDTTLPLWLQADPEKAKTLGEVRRMLEPKEGPAPRTVKGVSGAALGLDPKKSYTVQLDHAGNIVGRPLEESANESTAAQSPSGMSPAQERLVRGQFLSQTSDLRHRASMMGMAYAALQSAVGTHPNSAAYASAISKFVQAVDQDKNLREGMLHYFEQGLTPSLYGEVKKLLAKKAYGQFPPELVQGMLEHLAEMTTEISGQFDRIRSDFGTMYPGITLPKTETYFPVRTSTVGQPAAGASGGDRVRQFLGGR